jgi:hypothetical protein
MRLLILLLVIPIVCSASPQRVDGIPVRGDVTSVSVTDIRDAIRAVEDPVSSVTVLNADQMRVYYKLKDLGWIAVRRDPYAKNRGDHTWPGWFTRGRGVDDPEVSRFIRGAAELYVFPVLTPDKPRRDNKCLRRLDDQARRALASLLSDHRSWYQGGYTMVSAYPDPRNIGVLLRRGSSELVLFFSSSFTSSAGLIKGAFKGQHVQEMLEDAPGKKMEQWSRRFAQPELAPTNRSNQAMERTADRRAPNP